MKSLVRLSLLLCLCVSVPSFAANRNLAEVQARLAFEYLKLNDLTNALNAAKKAEVADDRYNLGLLSMALIYAYGGENQKAEQYFKRALALDKKDGDVNTQYGWFLCQKLNQPENAIPYFDTAISNTFYNNGQITQFQKAQCYRKVGRNDEALNLLNRLAIQNPNQPEILREMVLVSIEQLQPNKAQSYYERYAKTINEVNPADLWLAIRLSKLTNDRQEAEQLSQELIRRFPKSQEAQFLLYGNK
ncbi:MAG: tetratricopeptide repeat protein [Neisseriaceae bacterium]|nr:tetratricopeptide repeat protein [Neisseriaceae bacterium]